MNVLLDLYDDLVNPFIDLSFVPLGPLRERLARGRAAWRQERRIVDDVATRFASERVVIASGTELQCWERMDEAGGFKVYFEAGGAPSGWYMPSEWGDRQRVWKLHAHLPTQGSDDHAYMVAKGDELRSLRALAGEPFSSVHEVPSNGWFDWSRFALHGPDAGRVDAVETGFLRVQAASDEVFIINARSRDPEYVPPRCLEGCPMASDRQARWIARRPDLVLEKIGRGEDPTPGLIDLVLR